MKYSSTNNNDNAMINDVEVTEDNCKVRKSRKGQEISGIFKQLFCFFMDGTSQHLVYFDRLKEDEGYAGSIETKPEHMLSSHAVKRFFGAMLLPWGFMFRKVLRKLFLWRLQRFDVHRINDCLSVFTSKTSASFLVAFSNVT